MASSCMYNLFTLLLLCSLGDLIGYANAKEQHRKLDAPLCTTGLMCCDITDAAILTNQQDYDFSDMVGCVDLFSNTCNNTQLDANFCGCGPNANSISNSDLNDGWYFDCDTDMCKYDTTHTGYEDATGDLTIMETKSECTWNDIGNVLVGAGQAFLGIIIGAIVGGIVFLIVLGICIAKCCCKPKVVVVQQGAAK